VYNISMSNASDGARIKVWPGASSALSGDLQGGGGGGAVRNITYDGMAISNVDYAIEITQCYGQKNLTLCNEVPFLEIPYEFLFYALLTRMQFPSNLTISDITVKNFHGTTSKKYDPLVGYLVCSSPSVCSNIKIENVDVTSPSGANQYTCLNIDGIGSQVNCTTAGGKGGES
jgi:galacturan 1,4-alpha-galacturonidase